MGVVVRREVVERVAQIMGTESAAAHAIADADKRGTPVVFVSEGGYLFVVPDDGTEETADGQ
jgi:hypothetical protein